MSIRSFALSLISALTLLVSFLEPSQAQGIRVYTSVTDVTKEGEPQALSHSLTLFHAGKVYDYMEEVGEVVIFEPIHNRFIIMGKNFTATEVSFTELNHFLEAANKETTQAIEQYTSEGNVDAAKKAANMRFQLSPEFHKAYDAARHQITMSGTELSYSITGQPVESTTVVNRYLEYADWASRLNFVLHPHSLLPQSRLKVNEVLREQRLLPTKVQLTMHLNPEVKFRAVHRFSDDLQAIDRQHISMWERTLKSDEIRWLTFHEYQQNLLVQMGK